MLRKSALQQYPVAVVQYAEADWGAAVGNSRVAAATVAGRDKERTEELVWPQTEPITE